VYTLGPAFRADRNHTSQHLAEFRMLEAECGFEWELERAIQLVEDLVRFLVAELLAQEGATKMELEACAPFAKRVAAAAGAAVEAATAPGHQQGEIVAEEGEDKGDEEGSSPVKVLPNFRIKFFKKGKK
jgi:hypothetical protein